ncbi:leucyl aminopeptidase [Pseudomonas daroniae]|uniref:Probable cytosol aminopeptidase n=1 Tax=Phytopseudomonas daroniae TaxID=2487519 RepID=A0A4Q9QRT7_9GAMM|nr:MULTISPECIES: leucyl aminopeptidase [Pseudomonas]TBU77233.1 leucyl aminopeptidase [Pseudomonas daroniae]TBU83250.1 leucyl aminopeptidase [Pseudomonas daroniae]TBU84889.1 leucyl aminopeptidase [Pseudomonas sp. FRB 228]TBU93818.1 leucyl aminopeptidase [Pseudomonas daroniae]
MNNFFKDQDSVMHIPTVELLSSLTMDLQDYQVKTDCIVLGVFEDQILDKSYFLPNSSSEVLINAGVTGLKPGRARDVLTPARRYILAGLGRYAEFDMEALRAATQLLAAALLESGCRRAYWILDSFGQSLSLQDKLREIAFSLHRATYIPPKISGQTTQVDDAALHNVLVSGQVVSAEHSLALDNALHCIEGMRVAQDLSNLPPNHCTPAVLAERAQALQGQALSCEVLAQEDIETLGMGGLLAVAQGACVPPRFIIMQYTGTAPSTSPVVLIGKGVTFDSGGLSIKPSSAQEDMKFDMAGAGIVIGVMRAAALAKLSINVVALIPACENMPSGKACRPGDVITTLSGKTVEILNTDAEGRLILCDALTYAHRFAPSAVIDVATLTGGVIAALGHHRSGLFANDETLAAELLHAADSSADLIWRLPLDKAYREPLLSRNADLANYRKGSPSSITGAMFLNEFTEGLSWAHLDIAGTAWISGKESEATGRTIPLLFEYLRARASRG